MISYDYMISYHPNPHMTIIRIIIILLISLSLSLYFLLSPSSPHDDYDNTYNSLTCTRVTRALPMIRIKHDGYDITHTHIPFFEFLSVMILKGDDYMRSYRPKG
jgi:hypothetical protein